VAVLGGFSERVSAAEFPDLRENTGNFLEITPGRDAARQHTQGIADEIPYQTNREISEANRECSLKKQGPPAPANECLQLAK
jgi:hypothetical protein